MKKDIVRKVLAGALSLTALVTACSSTKVSAGNSIDTPTSTSQSPTKSPGSAIPKKTVKVSPGTEPETIVFTAEKKAVVLEGRLERTGAHKVYVLDLNKDLLAKDRVLYAQLSSPNNKTIGFIVFDPKGENIGTPGDYSWDWEDEISVEGTYRIDVSALKGAGNYKLKVILKNELRKD